MPGLGPGIHDLNTTLEDQNSWMPGTRPGMTGSGSCGRTFRHLLLDESQNRGREAGTGALVMAGVSAVGTAAAGTLVVAAGTCWAASPPQPPSRPA